MVLLVLTSITGVFLWTLYQNTLYNYAVRGQNQQELDVRNENVVANGNYSVPSPGKVSVIANLTNAGPVTAQIVNLWVFDTSRQTYGFNNSVGNKPWANLSWTTLKAGQVLKFTSNNATKVTVPNANSTDSFSIWFVTARGNTVPLTKSQANTLITAQVSQGIGSVAMDFSSFLYYNVSGNTLLSYPNGGSGYIVNSKGNAIVFKIRLTNFDYPQRRTITLFSFSVLWSLFPQTPQSQRGAPWYIVNVNGNLVENTFNNVTLYYGVPKDVYFSAQSAMPMAGGFKGQSFPQQGIPGTAPVNIALIGEIGSSPYGQNLPFASIYVKS